ncbi:MAG TPA: FkbM family methyltransferase [Planctomycetota bacterium]|nr:FkbM family methyltransferase [Planctomycetota bacterium]
MTILGRVRDNVWLLGACRDWTTLCAMKQRDVGATETVQSLRFRALQTPVLVRSGTTDISVAWELFRLQEYECTRGWDFPRVVDCGANVGMFLAFAASKMNGRLERYVGVEADAAAFSMLQRQAGALRLEPKAVLLHAAVWECDGEVSFDDRGPSWARHVSDQGRTRVRAMSMDSILDAAGMEECDLLKLDIEGGERAVLPGLNTWGGRVRTFVAELHDGLDYAWFAALADAAGFEPYPPGKLFRAHPSAVRRNSRRA